VHKKVTQKTVFTELGSVWQHTTEAELFLYRYTYSVIYVLEYTTHKHGVCISHL